nr:uncharacterized protein LOC111428791 [Onthophagus taurus]
MKRISYVVVATLLLAMVVIADNVVVCKAQNLDSLAPVNDNLFEVVRTNISHPQLNNIKTVVYASTQFEGKNLAPNRVKYISDFLNKLYPEQIWNVIENYVEGYIYSDQYVNMKVYAFGYENHQRRDWIQYYIFTI